MSIGILNPEIAEAIAYAQKQGELNCKLEAGQMIDETTNHIVASELHRAFAVGYKLAAENYKKENFEIYWTALNRLGAERDHWKANHDNVVRRKRNLSQRHGFLVSFLKTQNEKFKQWCLLHRSRWE